MSGNELHVAAQQIEEVRRADECRHDANANFHTREQDAPQGIADDEEDAARQETRGQQTPMVGTDQKAHHVRHDETDEANVAADADARCRRQRRERQKQQAEEGHGHARGTRLDLAEREEVQMA